MHVATGGTRVSLISFILRQIATAMLCLSDTIAGMSLDLFHEPGLAVAVSILLGVELVHH